VSPSYGEYLRLDRLLDAQRPLSQQHDEMRFVVIHELSAAVDHVRRDALAKSM
jgi:tryptophan 2,3-dioxygenase